MTLIFADPSVTLYSDPVRDSAPPPNSSDIPSLASPPVAGSPTPNPASLAPSESFIDLDIRRSHRVRAPPSHLTVIIYTLHLLLSMSLIPIMRLALILFGSKL